MKILLVGGSHDGEKVEVNPVYKDGDLLRMPVKGELDFHPLGNMEDVVKIENYYFRRARSVDKPDLVWFQAAEIMADRDAVAYLLGAHTKARKRFDDLKEWVNKYAEDLDKRVTPGDVYFQARASAFRDVYEYLFKMELERANGRKGA